MNGLTQRYRTLGELLTELKARLGFVAQGPAANNNTPLMMSFLQEAHEYVYDQLDPSPMRKKTVIALEQGSYLYDWHNDEEDENIDPGLVHSVWLIDGDNGAAQGRYVARPAAALRHAQRADRVVAGAGPGGVWLAGGIYREPSAFFAGCRPARGAGQAGAVVCAGQRESALPASRCAVGGGAVQCQDAAGAGAPA